MPFNVKFAIGQSGYVSVFEMKCCVFFSVCHAAGVLAFKEVQGSLVRDKRFPVCEVLFICLETLITFTCGSVRDQS